VGFRSALDRLKRIAEHVDAPTTKIEDWQWRPLSDFHRDTGYIEEVPSYIQDNFGRFMQEQTERARRGEMGPRDLLKAYGITRSSVMRTARKLDDVERSGLKIYDPESNLIRPEGAFASWLMSPAGQKYLEFAEQGVADIDSIEDIRNKFRVFGMQNMLADDLRYAAENLAPKGHELNEMLFAPIDDWRRFTEGIKGVSSGKSGFPASMLGRGDIGTFDAREIKGHTGMSSEDAGKYMSRSRQGRPIGGYEAVDRMGDRQRALDVRLEPDLEPYYQHLVHHGNWDALEGDQTTHNDLIRVLRPGMAKGGLVALMEKAFKAAQEAPKETVKAYKLFRTNPKYPEHLFPLFVDADRPVPMSEWLRAEAGPVGKTEDSVKSKLGDLAYRPGWHAGDLPIATHIGGKSAKGLRRPDYRPDNQVWAEIEMPADIDWQTEALARAQFNKRGKMIPRTAHITDQVPYGGHYRYKTNPNMTGNWLIGGDMRVNRVLTDEEVKAINDAHGVADLPRFKAEDIGKPEYAKGGLVALMERALKLAQERAALPVEQHGLGLHPLNTPAERAEAMGFTVPAYHGSGSPDIERFRLNTDDEAKVLAQYRQAVAENKPYGYMNFRSGSFFSPQPDYAGNYANGDAATMYPVLLKANNPGRVGSGFEPLKLRRTPDSLEMYNNGSLDEIVIMEPDNIRSRFAVFDPWRMNSGIAAALGLAAPDLLADEDER